MGAHALQILEEGIIVGKGGIIDVAFEGFGVQREQLRRDESRSGHELRIQAGRTRGHALIEAVGVIGVEAGAGIAVEAGEMLAHLGIQFERAQHVFTALSKRTGAIPPPQVPKIPVICGITPDAIAVFM